MIKTHDIKDQMNLQLLMHNYGEVPLEEKKKVVQRAFEQYTIFKMVRPELFPKFKKTTYDLSLLNLLQHMNSCLTKEEREPFFENYITYLLELVGSLQASKIEWHKYYQQQYLNQPILKTKDGKWEKLITHKKVDLFSLFKTLYVEFIENFNAIDKEYTLQKKLV